jgi:DNA-binding NtrC family response regulator
MAPEVEPLVVVATADLAAAHEVSPLLRQWGCRVALVGDVGQLAALAAVESPALLLLDSALEPDGGERLVSTIPGLTVALLSSRNPCSAGETATRFGVFDYVTWPIDSNRLRVILAHATERHRLLERIRRLEQQNSAPATDDADIALRAIDRLEKGAIVDALRRVGGNVREAARMLGFGQATVYRKIKRYNISLPGRARQTEPEPALAPIPSDSARSCG